MATKMPHLHCVKCLKSFFSFDNIIQCSGKCGSLFHMDCIALLPSEKKALAECDRLFWLCNSCENVELKSISKTLPKLILTIAELSEEIKELRKYKENIHNQNGTPTQKSQESSDSKRTTGGIVESFKDRLKTADTIDNGISMALPNYYRMVLDSSLSPIEEQTSTLTNDGDEKADIEMAETSSKIEDLFTTEKTDDKHDTLPVCKKNTEPHNSLGNVEVNPKTRSSTEIDEDVFTPEKTDEKHDTLPISKRNGEVHGSSLKVEGKQETKTKTDDDDLVSPEKTDEKHETLSVNKRNRKVHRSSLKVEGKQETNSKTDEDDLVSPERTDEKHETLSVSKRNRKVHRSSLKVEGKQETKSKTYEDDLVSPEKTDEKHEMLRVSKRNAKPHNSSGKVERKQETCSSTDADGVFTLEKTNEKHETLRASERNAKPQNPSVKVKRKQETKPGSDKEDSFTPEKTDEKHETSRGNKRNPKPHNSSVKPERKEEMKPNTSKTGKKNISPGFIDKSINKMDDEEMDIFNCSAVLVSSNEELLKNNVRIISDSTTISQWINDTFQHIKVGEILRDSERRSLNVIELAPGEITNGICEMSTLPYPGSNELLMESTIAGNPLLEPSISSLELSLPQAIPANFSNVFPRKRRVRSSGKNMDDDLEEEIVEDVCNKENNGTFVNQLDYSLASESFPSTITPGTTHIIESDKSQDSPDGILPTPPKNERKPSSPNKNTPTRSGEKSKKSKTKPERDSRNLCLSIPSSPSKTPISKIPDSEDVNLKTPPNRSVEKKHHLSSTNRSSLSRLSMQSTNTQSTTQDDTDSTENSGRRTRRAGTGKSYKDPPLNKKLRRN